jgi:hypothetical protein
LTWSLALEEKIMKMQSHQSSEAIGDLRALTDEEMNAISGGMKTEAYVGDMHMTITADANHYVVVVQER